MRIIISLIIFALPIIGFSQKTLNGKYRELSEPSNVEYKFKGNRFEYHANADVIDFFGKGEFELNNDSLILYFDLHKNESVVEYQGEKNANAESTFQLTVFDESNKTGLIGAKVQFYTSDKEMVAKDYVNEKGKFEFKTQKHIKSIIISYIGKNDLVLDVEQEHNNHHQYQVIWKTISTKTISGEIWRFEISDIKKKSFKLKKNGDLFSYKRKCF